MKSAAREAVRDVPTRGYSGEDPPGVIRRLISRSSPFEFLPRMKHMRFKRQTESSLRQICTLPSLDAAGPSPQTSTAPLCPFADRSVFLHLYFCTE